MCAYTSAAHDYEHNYKGSSPEHLKHKPYIQEFPSGSMASRRRQGEPLAMQSKVRTEPLPAKTIFEGPMQAHLTMFPQPKLVFACGPRANEALQDIRTADVLIHHLGMGRRMYVRVYIYIYSMMARQQSMHLGRRTGSTDCSACVR